MDPETGVQTMALLYEEEKVQRECSVLSVRGSPRTPVIWGGGRSKLFSTNTKFTLQRPDSVAEGS